MLIHTYEVKFRNWISSMIPPCICLSDIEEINMTILANRQITRQTDIAPNPLNAITNIKSPLSYLIGAVLYQI